MSHTGPEHDLNLYLIGLRGTGKTSVGRLAATELGWAFADTDALVEQHAARSIAEIFAADGETAFRELEVDAVAEATRTRPSVVSLGGGAVLREENRAAIRATGVCVWLTAAPAELEQRLRDDPRTVTQRPRLTGAEVADEIRTVLAQRRSLYEALAQHVVDTTGRPVAEVARDVVALARMSPPPDLS